MMHVPQGDTYYLKFTTRAFATGAPTTLAGTPAVSVYEENNLTQITAGVSLTVDYDGVTGLNDVSIAATSGNGYDVGSYYSVVITTGTVDSVSVVGEVVGHFRVMPAEDAGAGIPDVNVAAVSDDSGAADNLEADYDGTGYNKSASTIGTCTANTDMRGTDNALLAASAPTNFGDLAITVTTGEVTVGTNNDKTGYSLTQAFPTNFADMAITVTTGLVSVGTNNDKTGYDLNADQSAVTIGTVTTNTDMRGTDNALLAASAPTNFGDLSITLTTGLVDINDKTGFSLAGTTDANVVQISGDTTAADNLELMYDGTGYTDDTAPASRSQVGALSVGSASISTTAGSVTITTGVETGSYTDTAELDGTYHEIADVANVTDFYYQFDVGGDGVPTEFQWNGYAQGNGSTYNVFAYNWGGASWDQIGSISGTAPATDQSSNFQATVAHVGTGANLGVVRLRFESSDGANINTDRILCSYAVVARSVGYALGAIWVDTNASNTNTESYVDGVADNPVSTWAAALTLSSQLGINRFQIAAGSSITLSASSDAYSITGPDAALDLNGQSIEGTVVNNMNVSGTGTATVSPPQFRLCSIGTATLPPCYLFNCGFAGTWTVGSAGDFFAVDCYSQVAGAGSPIMDMAAVGATNFSLRRFGGGLQFNNLASGDVVSAEATVGGTLTLNGADATVEVRGGWKQVTNNLTGTPTVTDVSVNARFDATQGATFDTATDSLEALKDSQPTNFTDLSITASTGRVDMGAISGSTTAADNLEESTEAIVPGAAVTGTLTTTSCTTDLTGFADDELTGRVIIFKSGTANGQAATITDYTAAGGLVQYAGGIATAPANGDAFVIT